jgi:transposase
MPRFAAGVKDSARRMDSLGVSRSAIALYLNCSTRSIRRWLRHYRLNGHYGSQRYPSADRRPRRLSSADVQAVVQWLRASPELNIHDLTVLLGFERDIYVSPSTVYRTLHRAGYSRKRLARQAKERNLAARIAFWERVAILYKPSQLVFCDETSKDRRTTLRKHGYSPLGIRASSVQTMNRGRRYSILAAVAIDGWVASAIYPGSVNTERFNAFVIEQLVRLLFDTVEIASCPT